MKNFLLTFTAVLLAAGLALFAYDRLVLKPRLEEVGRSAQVSLQEARNEAQEIAENLDAEVTRSVANAKTALDEQAAAETRRRDEQAAADTLQREAIAAADARQREVQAAEVQKMTEAAQAGEALARASSVKAMVAEHYMSMGDWPRSLADVGQGQPADYEGGPVASITIETAGVIAIAMKPDVARGAMLRLVPTAKPTGMIEWRCRPSDYPAAERLPACR